MHDEQVKICRDCGAEYAPEAMQCADCGGMLVYPKELPDGSEPLPEDSDMVCIRETKLNHVHEVSRLLNEKGIRTEVKLHKADQVHGAYASMYGLYVAPADEKAAKEVDRQHWLKGAPDQGRTYEYTEQELSGKCPACGAEIPKGKNECPDCGLAAGHADETDVCPACNADIDADATKCPNCGAEFES